jgi:hypothetical protein
MQQRPLARRSIHAKHAEPAGNDNDCKDEKVSSYKPERDLSGSGPLDSGGARNRVAAQTPPHSSPPNSGPLPHSGSLLQRGCWRPLAGRSEAAEVALRGSSSWT